VLLPLALFNYAGIQGVDFGLHWDETEHLVNVQHSLQTETLLPAGGYTLNNDLRLATGYYAYPSVLYWVALAGASPEILRQPDHVTDPALAQFVVSQPFRLRVRAVCVVISSLAVLWLYLGVLRCGRSPLEALFAAMLLAGSWEISYHSRWIAPDTIVMQFSALCLLLCACVLSSPAWKRWAKCAAVSAGLAAGTKYPAALLLVPVLTAAIARKSESCSLFRIAAKLCLIALATFIITTPGALLQPWPFLHWLAYQHRHYGSETHLGYTVAGPWDHTVKILIYQAFVLWSHWAWLAALLFALAPAGAVWMCRKDRPLALVALIFPIVYLAWFSTQRVMIVRNLLVVSPFIAFLCARGLGELTSLLRHKVLQSALILSAAAILIVNAIFVIHASLTIIESGNTLTYDLRGLRDFIRQHASDTAFYLSAPTRDLLRQLDPSAADQPNPPHASRQLIVVGSHDDNDTLQWPANIWNLAAVDFGPRDVNFNYYPTWMRNRIVALDLDRAKTLPVDVVRNLVLHHDAPP
jgi:4-amino-4-deoxy-L-arabinose transferase-like glycosyltransferase